ncbi:MAG: site-specific DNA-methyltransferase [Prevotellaceae bacterium]|nr:site-specific DNA-methyltransferase [Prevotellaceae bacterium]
MRGGAKATRLRNESIQPNTDLLNTLRLATPQFFDAAGNFKADKFAEELKANNIAEAHDGYKLSFVGKDYARLQTGLQSETMIAPDSRHNALPENANSGNVFITGDNLEALRHLQNAYSGKIKMIYIDPPYNTGKEFVYNDKFEFDDEKLQSALGYNEDEIERLKSIQGKSSHSAWLTFMYPRLKLAQKLLSDDGVIFVSIDDNEQANLKLLMDDVFGEGNFVANMIRQEKAGAGHDSKELAIEYDYIVVYSKNKTTLKINKENVDVGNDIKYRYQDNFVNERGKYYLRDLNYKGSYSPSLDYPIVLPNGKTIFSGGIQGRPNTWRWSEAKFKWGIENDFIIFKEDRVYIKQYQFVDNEGNLIDRFIPYRALTKFLNSEGTIELTKLGLNAVFNFPKSVNLLKYLLQIATNKNSLILDFFAGSATTAHAVMQLNSEDGGERKYIMVQLDEPTNLESEARKAGYDTIDKISRERIKKAGEKILNEYNSDLAKQSNGWDKDTGFKHYHLKTSDVQTLDKITDFDPSKPQFDFGDDRDVLSILQTWLLADGNKFDTKIENITLGDYTAPYVKEAGTIYLIEPNFGTQALEALLNKIGKNELSVSTICIYPYSFTFTELLELKNNVKNNLDYPPTIIERY